MALSPSIPEIICQADWKIQAIAVALFLLWEFYLGKSKKIAQSSTVEIVIFILTVVVGVITNILRRKKNESL